MHGIVGTSLVIDPWGKFKAINDFSQTFLACVPFVLCFSCHKFAGSCISISVGYPDDNLSR